MKFIALMLISPYCCLGSLHPFCAFDLAAALGLWRKKLAQLERSVSLRLRQEAQAVLWRARCESRYTLFREPDKDSAIGSQPSTSALPLKIFLNMGRVELQVPTSSDAADLALLHPEIKVLGMAVEEVCGFTCGAELGYF
jgi:hypothetical protein